MHCEQPRVRSCQYAASETAKTCGSAARDRLVREARHVDLGVRRERLVRVARDQQPPPGEGVDLALLVAPAHVLEDAGLGELDELAVVRHRRSQVAERAAAPRGAALLPWLQVLLAKTGRSENLIKFFVVLHSSPFTALSAICVGRPLSPDGAFRPRTRRGDACTAAPRAPIARPRVSDARRRRRADGAGARRRHRAGGRARRAGRVLRPALPHRRRRRAQRRGGRSIARAPCDAGQAASSCRRSRRAALPPARRPRATLASRRRTRTGCSLGRRHDAVARPFAPIRGGGGGVARRSDAPEPYGFAGCTEFFAPSGSLWAVAARCSGMLEGFTAAGRYTCPPWSPTANLMLRRGRRRRHREAPTRPSRGRRAASGRGCWATARGGGGGRRGGGRRRGTVVRRTDEPPRAAAGRGRRHLRELVLLDARAAPLLLDALPTVLPLARACCSRPGRRAHATSVERARRRRAPS